MIKIRYLGTNSLYVSDGRSGFMIDPYFSRWQGMLGLPYFYRKVAPSKFAVKKVLGKFDINDLDAILITHSHFDHVMDSPLVSELTEGRIYGSESTANVALGGGVADYEIVKGFDQIDSGDFKITFMPSKHLTFPLFFNEILGVGHDITSPLTLPARGIDYKEGGCFALLIEHPELTLLNQGSANWLEGVLDGVKIDLVLPGIAGLDLKSNRYLEYYYKETILKTEPKQILFTHWDDFNIGLFDNPGWIRHTRKSYEKLMHWIERDFGRNYASRMELMKEYRWCSGFSC